MCVCGHCWLRLATNEMDIVFIWILWVSGCQPLLCDKPADQLKLHGSEWVDSLCCVTSPRPTPSFKGATPHSTLGEDRKCCASREFKIPRKTLQITPMDSLLVKMDSRWCFQMTCGNRTLVSWGIGCRCLTPVRLWTHLAWAHADTPHHFGQPNLQGSLQSPYLQWTLWTTYPSRTSTVWPRRP